MVGGHRHLAGAVPRDRDLHLVQHHICYPALGIQQNGSCDGIDLARAFLIRRFGQDAKAGAVCSVLARLR